MQELARLYGQTGQPARRLGAEDRKRVAEALAAKFPKLIVYGESPCAVPGGILAAARDGHSRKILAVGSAQGLAGNSSAGVTVCDATAANYQALRKAVAYLKPVLAGTKASFGTGDRLGISTPGHIAAASASGLFLILAQQSIREMTRTGRTAQEVMDDATFGVFQSGYDAGFGADADHLKTTDDVNVTAAAGFTFFTIDPSPYVDDTVNAASDAELAARVEKMAAEGVTGASTWKNKYLEKAFQLNGLTIRFNSQTLLKAAAKYGRAIAHAEVMARHIAKVAPIHEIELSVDETAAPTSTAEHLFVINELHGRGIKIASLAPRFVGEFEKGVDYKGDLKGFEAALREHVVIAQHYGKYKISIHSGSDKFSLYPSVARITGGNFHLKTAGTSYLEALRVIVRSDKPLFREIIGFCRERFETDKASYHISATLQSVPAATELADGDLERVYLDENHGRQILHVTFGSVLLTKDSAGKPLFKSRIMDVLHREADLYVEVLKKHIGRHAEPLRRN